MATLTDTDGDELEIVEIPAEGEEIATEPAAEAEAPAEDADDEDERLAQDDGDDEDADDAKDDTAARKRRKTRRERQKRAQQQSDAEKEILRTQLAEVTNRLIALEGNAVNNTELGIDQRLAQAQRTFNEAKAILAQAIDAGNGADAQQALDIRDAAAAEIQQLSGAKQHVTQLREQATQPRVDPRVEFHKTQWVDANKAWFDGRSEDSQIALAIDRAVAGEGYDPATPAYWSEVSRRCTARFGSPSDTRQSANPRRSPPPQSNSREHVPDGARSNKVYVTAERKQAMIDAGMWDDPEKRNRVLKAYQEQDRSASASQKGARP